MLGRGGLSMFSQRGAGGPPDPTALFTAYALASPMWYDLADQTKTFQDTAGTTPATAAADPVGRVTNKGTLSTIHWLQSVAGSRPVLASSAGKMLATFNGTTSALNTGAQTFGTSTYSLFLVVEPGAAETKWLICDSANSSKIYALADAAGGAASAGVGADSFGPSPAYFIDGKRVINSLGTAPKADDISTGIPATTRHILEARGLNLSTATGLRMGDYSGWEFGGKVGEVILGLDPTYQQRDSILYSLAAKWSITLPNSLASLGWASSMSEREFGRFAAVSTGARIAFDTTATSLTFYAISQTPDASTRILGLYVDGVYQSVTYPLGTAPPQNIIVSGLSASSKRIVLSSPYRNTDSAGLPQGTFLLRVDANASMTRATLPASTGGIIFFGDSIMGGGNATPILTASAVEIVRTTATIPVINDGLSSNSLYQTINTALLRAAYVAQVVAKAATKLWIEHGTNDYGGNYWTAANFQTAYAALLDDLHTALPSLQVYAQSPFTRTTETANGLGSTLGDYRTAVSGACSGRSWATFVDGTAICNSGDLADGLHLTNGGHVKWAAAIRSTAGV